VGYLVLGAVLGAALTLAVQLVIQFCVVPRVETRKRREDRWERDVRELGELLTTQLAERADAANVEQSAFRFLLQLESTADADKDKVSHLKDEHSLKARHATAAFNDLAHTRVPWLVGRVKSIDPDSAEIVKFGTVARHHRIRAISVDDWSGVYVHPEDPTFDEAWDQERDARRALVEQVTALLDLQHPPRASLRRRWWRRGARRIHAGIARTSPQPLKPANEGLGAVLRDNGQALDRCAAAVQRGQQRLS